MKNYLLLLAFFFGFLIPTIATAQPAKDDAFLRMLRAPDVLPTKKELLLRYPDAAKRLIELATRKSSYQARSISMLSYFPSKNVDDTLIDLLQSKQAQIRGLAIYTLVRSSYDRTRALQTANKYVNVRDESLRAMLAKALAHHRDGRSLLLMMTKDKSEFVAASAKMALQKQK